MGGERGRRPLVVREEGTVALTFPLNVYFGHLLSLRSLRWSFGQWTDSLERNSRRKGVVD